MDASGTTAFRETARQLGRQVREAAVDHEAFERPMRRCELARCRATCCHDGVILGAEEARVIGEVVEAERDALAQLGWEGGEWLAERDGQLKTRTRAATGEELAEDFPAHFPRTRCVFLDSAHRCVLQRLAVLRGRPAWFWKPMSCWMQPLRLAGGGSGRPVLTVATPENDPLRAPGYPGFSSCTPCGRLQAGGERAAEVLAEELRMLGALGDRDLKAELGGGSF